MKQGACLRSEIRTGAAQFVPLSVTQLVLLTNWKNSLGQVMDALEIYRTPRRWRKVDTA